MVVVLGIESHLDRIGITRSDSLDISAGEQMINTEIKTTDQEVMDVILDIARKCGGVVEERTPLMRGYASVEIEDCTEEFMDLIRGGGIGRRARSTLWRGTLTATREASKVRILT